MIRFKDGDLVWPGKSGDRLLATAAELKAALAEAGMVIVPVEPSDKMLAAMAECYDPTWGYTGRSVADDWARDSYKAALKEAEHD